MHTIAFTGSGPVGLEIVRRAAELAPGQKHLKRVVAEMGGKNCVIVDSDADLDDVVPALVKSAFNYAGQKCSAAARVLAHEAIHDGLVERLAGAIEVLHVGQASDPEIDVPPVIEREAQERVARYAATAQASGRIAARAAEVPDRGCFATPDARHRAARGLAGAAGGDLRPAAGGRARQVRSRRRATASTPRRTGSPAGCSRARRARSTTSPTARPSATSTSTARSPARWSAASRSAATGSRGTGTKAGGPAYLLQFVEPTVITENTVRHGLVV